MTTRERMRIILLVAGALPALLVLAYTVKVALMLHHNADGRDAFDRGDYDGSRLAFADTRTLNWFEGWVAEFDEGTAHHGEGDHDEAITDYETALEGVPAREECTVRINLALAHESVGDALLERGDRAGAVESWQAGIDALAAGGCPERSGRGEAQTEDAQAVDERLRAKLEEAQQDPQEGRPPPPPEQPGDSEQPKDPREERLERNNEEGLEQRQKDRELYRDRDYSRPYSW